MELYLALAIPILIATAWLYTAQVTRTSLPTLKNKRICLLIAHPDDEAMFFAPTILALTAPGLENHLKILCMSNGNADGLGDIRKQELTSSASVLGLRAPTDVLVLEDSRFPDSMTAHWAPGEIAGVLSSAFSPSLSGVFGKKPSTSSLSDAPSASIDILITFDPHGVSSHPNHISLCRGSRAWLSSLMAGKLAWKAPVALYSLTTTNMLRKYMSVFDVPTTLLMASFRGSWIGPSKRNGEPPNLLFINNYAEWRAGQTAMVKGHRSQMQWFRWGWIGIGRYMIVNDLKREAIE